VAIRDRLFTIVERLSRSGVGIIFISHRMDEMREIADRITVMRSGETVATLERQDWNPDQLVRLMTGADRLTEQAGMRATIPREESKQVVLTAQGLVLAPGRRSCDVTIREGELVGVAGLEGHGQNEFLEALRGARRAGGKVIRHERDRAVVIRSTSHAAAHGIAYVPRERAHAVFHWMSISENFGMPTLRRDTRAGWLRPRHTVRRFSHYVQQLKIVLGAPGDRITSLSGGNQQKVVIARWLAAEPQILLLNDPTRGVDIGTKRELYALLTRLADNGLAVVMLSSELDEHIELMDRVFVFREHELYREVSRERLSRHALGSAFFGEDDPADVGI
jgi:ABC-type sugar transport system ATPase subunit